MNDAVLTVQRIMSVLDILQLRPEREGFAVLSFQPGQPKAAWVCYGGERLAALEAGYRMLGHAAEFWVQDIAETLSWGPAAVAGEVEYQSWALHASMQPAADELVAEHMRLVAEYVRAAFRHSAEHGAMVQTYWKQEVSAHAAVESSARALLAAGREDAELADFRRRVDAVCKQAASTPGVPVPIDPEVRVEMHKFMRDEPSLFDRLAWGEFKALATIQPTST